MSANKLKHLEFIHNTINRMSTHSFIIKGWVITITSALFVLSNKTSNPKFILLSFFAIPTFWFLNAYFLLIERKFRALYNEVRIKDEKKIDFSMDTKKIKSWRCSLLGCVFSISIWPLYIFMLTITYTIMFLI